jgi:hypothetical protein
MLQSCDGTVCPPPKSARTKSDSLQSDPSGWISPGKRRAVIGCYFCTPRGEHTRRDDAMAAGWGHGYGLGHGYWGRTREEAGLPQVVDRLASQPPHWHWHSPGTVGSSHTGLRGDQAGRDSRQTGRQARQAEQSTKESVAQCRRWVKSLRALDLERAKDSAFSEQASEKELSDRSLPRCRRSMPDAATAGRSAMVPSVCPP